jgi:hypothetical protein
MLKRLEYEWDRVGGWLTFGVLLFLYFGMVPGRIAAHFGAPTEWNLMISGLWPLALMFVVMGLVLLWRQIAPAR